MGNLIKYANKSKLMNLFIRYGDEKFKFNLFEEAQINEDIIQRELKDQPSAYGFLGVLHAKIKKKEADVETSCKRKYAELYVMYKDQINKITGRPNADDLCREKVLIHPAYIKLEDELNAIREKTNLLAVCVKTFDQRSSLIQTISANNRKTI
jgi:hypothetical protein